MRRAAVVAALAGAAACSAAQDRTPYGERFAARCVACHGAQGRSALPLTPSLAGQPAFYAITQLFLFREGRRDSAAMVEVAKTMSDDDLRGYADFIGTLPPPAAPAGAAVDAPRMQRGQALAQRLHCTGCHGADLAGARQVPRIANQREDYLLLALRGFRAGTRLGYTNAMGEALAGTTPADIEDLAHYLAHVGAR